jgi:ribosomal protein S18 acetylase RimI-like enzyme
MITIREYEEKDWAIVCLVHNRARPDELRGSCDPRAFIPIEDDPEVKDLGRAHKHVATDGERVVGFVGFNGDYLAWLYIDPDYYRQGIGRRLLQLAVAEIGSNAWTIVLDQNIGAIRLYESEGFREAGRFDSNNNGYPCICVRLELQSSLTA